MRPTRVAVVLPDQDDREVFLNWDTALDDGLLDVAIVAHQPEMKLTQMVAELKTIDNPDNQFLYYRQLAKFTIETKREVHFNLDGEPMRAKRFKFSILPKHLGLAF